MGITPQTNLLQEEASLLKKIERRSGKEKASKGRKEDNFNYSGRKRTRKEGPFGNRNVRQS